MVKHTKNKQIASSNCLQMEPKGNVFFKEKVQVDYSIGSEELRKCRSMEFLKSDRSVKPSIIPTYNNDKICYTPSFYLPGQSIDTRLYETRYKSNLVSLQEIDQPDILPPKPKDKVYCFVCQCMLQDYQKHIKSQIHFEKQKRNKYHNKIIKLCKKIEKTDLNQRNLKLPKDLFDDSSSLPLIINKKPQPKVVIDLTQYSN